MDVRRIAVEGELLDRFRMKSIPRLVDKYAAQRAPFRLSKS